MTTPAEEYKQRHAAFLVRVASQLEEYIRGRFDGTPHIDRVAARAKDPGRFAEKSARVDDKGNPKYKAPLTEIQDLIGARVIVFYRTDVDVAAGVVRRYFQPIEQQQLVPESHWEFGYFGEHFVLPLPKDVIPQDVDPAQCPSFFELQIKTLFQHAWSEANHDLGYKAARDLKPEQLRYLAYTAAQAWGADRVFAELDEALSRPGD